MAAATHSTDVSVGLGMSGTTADLMDLKTGSLWAGTAGTITCVGSSFIHSGRGGRGWAMTRSAAEIGAGGFGAGGFAAGAFAAGAFGGPARPDRPDRRDRGRRGSHVRRQDVVVDQVFFVVVELVPLQCLRRRGRGAYAVCRGTISSTESSTS